MDGKWRCQGKLLLHNPRKLTAKSASCKKTLDTASEKAYELVYDFGEDRSVRLAIRAIAGQPFLLIEESSVGCDIPSWGLDSLPDFRPDTLYSDYDVRPLDYTGSRSMGSLPWCRWMLAGMKDGPERDLIGIYVVSPVLSSVEGRSCDEGPITASVRDRPPGRRRSPPRRRRSRTGPPRPRARPA